jgi:hypothetical protein
MLARGLVNPAIVLARLRPYLPAAAADLLDQPQLQLKWLPFSQELNLIQH